MPKNSSTDKFQSAPPRVRGRRVISVMQFYAAKFQSAPPRVRGRLMIVTCEVMSICISIRAPSCEGATAAAAMDMCDAYDFNPRPLV